MTLKARVIPCLDVKDGRVVKGVNFVDLIDAGDPVEAARAYDAAGADELCFLDITASSDNRETIFDVIARTAEQCFMPVKAPFNPRLPPKEELRLEVGRNLPLLRLPIDGPLSPVDALIALLASARYRKNRPEIESMPKVR